MSNVLRRLNECRSSKIFITIVVCFAMFVDQLFFAFFLPILPYTLPDRNGIAEDRGIYWTTILITIYGLAVLIVCPLVGWWTDRHASRRVPWFCSLLVLLMSVFMMWFTKTMALQILSRLLQGAASSTVWIVGMTIIIDTVTTKHAGEYMGHVALALNTGTFAGPLLGGVVFARAGYDAVWGMMLGFVVLSAVLRFLMVEKVAQSKFARPRSETSSINSEMRLATSYGDDYTHPMRNDGRRISLALTNIGPLVQPSQRPKSTSSAESRLPALLVLTFSMRMAVALLGVCIEAVIFTGFETVLALYVQEKFGYGSLEAGLMFVPLTLPSFFAPLLGRVIDRTTPRWALVLGFLWLCPVLVMARFVTYNSMGQKILLCALLVLVGLGLTVVLNPLIAEISYIAEERENVQARAPRKSGDEASAPFAQAYALFLMAYSAGNVIGPLVAGLIKDRANWATMCWVLGLLSGMAAIPCFVWSGERHDRRLSNSRTSDGRSEEAGQP